MTPNCEFSLLAAATGFASGMVQVSFSLQNGFEGRLLRKLRRKPIAIATAWCTAPCIGKSQRIKTQRVKLQKTSRNKKRCSQKIFQKISQKIEDITFTGC